jgi:predicted NACHT family NTPase
MSKPDYPWKRFWCPRSGQINLTGGYLADPQLNPDLVSLEAIAHIPCLVLLGEPGIGKSQEIKNLVEHTERQLNPSHSVLELNLRSCSSLATDLIQDQDFINWINGENHLYLFLDSLDEGMLGIQNLATQLADEFKKKKYKDKLSRLYLRIACRTAVFPQVLEKSLEELWNEDLEIYELAPLRYIDVEVAAKRESIESQGFLSEIWDKNLVPLAIKPVTLKFLLNIYKRHDGQFSSDQTLSNLYLEGCRLLAEEVNPSRLGANLRGNLEADQRLIVAARIAAVTVFANQFAVWTGIDQGEIPAEDVLIRQLTLGNETYDHRKTDVTEAAIREVLDSGLFSSRGPNRMGWAHQTYAEFLAAWYLVQHEVSVVQVMELISSSEDPENKLVPQLYETAAWLASMREDVLQEIIKTDPDVLLQSDVSTNADIRASIVDNLLTQYEQEKLFYRSRDKYHQYSKLNHPGLPTQLRPYICDSSKQINARSLSIDIAEACQASNLQEELVNLALASSQPIYLRVSAARAISSIGDADTKFKLKPLAMVQLSEDEDDQLKGYVLRSLWSDHLKAEELFSVLTRPKKRNFFGSYQMFIDYELLPKLQPDDLVASLNWIANQGTRCFGHPFSEISDIILIKAWEHFDLPDVVKGFTDAALVQWKKYQPIIAHNNKLQEQFKTALLKDVYKRRQLVEQTVLAVSASEEDLGFLLSSLSETILVKEDFFWMLDKIHNDDFHKIQRIWIQLVQWNFNRQDDKQVDALTTAIQKTNTLHEEFEFYLAKADTPKANYVEKQVRQNRRSDSLVEPSPKVRVLQLLDQLEAGNFDAWWQLNIRNERESDLTKFSEWQEAEQVTRKRIIEGAKNYILQHQGSVDYNWIGTKKYDRPALAGCRALQLLLKESPDFSNGLSIETWKKWTPAIIAAPYSDQHDSYLEIVKRAYLNAPEESISTLRKLIDKENQEHEYLFAIRRFDKCWDERLKLALLEKSKDPSLKPKCIGQLLEELIKQGLTEARDFAKSLISFPLPAAENEREKAVIASRVLIENLASSSWSFIWPLIQQDSSFGREVLELAANRYPRGMQFNLTETQLADLYLWLVTQYPYNEDPDYSNEVLAHFVTAREDMANLRDATLSQLKGRGSLQACNEIQRLIQELPNLTWLRKTLLAAQESMRRTTWKPPKPEDILQLVATQELSNLDLSSQLNKIDGSIQEMKDDPKIDRSVHISNSKNIRGITTGDTENSRPDDKAGFDWKFWLSITVTIAVALVSVAASGVFNDEIKKLWFNRNASPQVGPKLEKHTN